MDRMEQTILKGLLFNEEYTRKVFPFLKREYFHERSEQVLFEHTEQHVTQFQALPTREVLVISLTENETKLSQKEFDEAIEILEAIIADKDEEPDLDWLVDSTESFCKDKALYNGVMESIQIIDGKSKQSKNAIPEILSEALSVSFDQAIGHDYIEDTDERYAFYHRKEEKVPFDLDYFNQVTKGGVAKKTLNILLAGTNVGKSLCMCHFAASYLLRGLNVLYITCEMSEERIAERIDANLLDIPLDDLEEIPQQTFDSGINKLKAKLNGRLFIKEYPTGEANTEHFRHVMKELKLKKKFSPDVLFVDYINICSSSRLNQKAAINPYLYVKAIAEELRGLAVEFAIPVWSATQTNRQGFANSDIDLTDTAESFGLPATADFMAAIIETEDLEKLGQYLVKQLKNRYKDKAVNKKFCIGVDKPKMRLYDLSTTAQTNIVDSGQKPKATEHSKNNKDKKKNRFDKIQI